MWRSKNEVDRHVRELLAKIKNEQDRKLRGYNIARLYYGVGEWESARRYLSEYISIRPKSPEAQRLLGEIYESLNQKERAVFSYITSYTISDAQKDLVLKICELYTAIDNGDNAARLHWAEEGERLFPHHNSVLKLREALNLNRSSHSKEDLETIYKQEAEANQTSLNVHLKLLKLYGEWSKEDESKLTDAFHFIVRVESRRLFFNSYEWYHNVVIIIEAYESWKKPHKDKNFEELVLSILDRYVYQSLASSCCSPLTASCSIDEAAKKLQRFGDRLIDALKILSRESFCGEHMIKQYYFHLAMLFAIKGKNESVYHKEYLLGLLLIHSCEATKQYKVPSNSREIEVIKSFWYNVGCHRVSQSGHILTQLAASDGGEKKYVNKLKEISADPDTRKNIITFLFGLSSFSENSFIKCDEKFGKEILFVNKATLLHCDQDVSHFCSSDLRELVWLYMQYDNTGNATVAELKPKYFYFNFHFFRGIPFSSKVTTNAPETLSHLDLIAFIIATAFCHYSNDRNFSEGTHYPSVLCPDLHTVEQNEWWSSAAILCNKSSSKKLNRLRSVLQNGLESIRHLSPHFVPLPLTVHLARYFTSCYTKSREDCNSESEVDALGERAEYYWNKVISKCKKSCNMIFGSSVKSRLFEIPRTELSGSEKLEFEEEGIIFLAERLSIKGLKQEAIQLLSTIKTPRASFKRAMLYKEEAKELVKNCNLNSLSIATKSEYISLLNQARDTVILTLEIAQKQGIDSSDTLSTEFNTELNEELASIERSLAAVSVDDIPCDESSHGSPSFHSVLDLTNGNASSWGGRLQPHNASTPYRAVTSNPRITRQETSPGPPSGLVSQVKQLEEIQQNTMRNIENHNAALRAQNEVLLQTCQTMAAEFKQNVAFYKSFLGQKSNTDSMEPIIDQMKELAIDLKELRVEFKGLAAEVNDLRSSYVMKTNSQQIIGTTSAATDNNSSVYANSPAAIQDVYNTYMGFYNQPSVASPLVAPTSVFSSFQPPFLPPSTLQDQTYLHSHPTVVKAEPCLPTTEYASSNYQNICSSPSGYVSRTQSTMKNIQSKGPTNGIAPPHSFQIQLPSSETLTAFAAETTLKSSSPVFTTEGLLSTVPAPLYSAVTTNLSSQNTSSKNLLDPNRKLSISVDTSIKNSSPVFTTDNLLSNVPAPLYSAVIVVPSPEKTAPITLEPQQNTPSGLFSKVNISSGTLGFDTIAAKSPNVSVFQTKDDAAFQPKPLFGSSNDSRNKSVNDGDGSKDEVEDYEPQVEFKPVVPMPDLVEIKTGEEDEDRLFCERAKLFRYDITSKEWKERGVGELKLLKNKLNLKVRILMRREQTHKVCANHFIAADTKITAMVNSEKACVWAANDFADEEIKYEKFAARFKNQKLANEFRTAFEAAQKNLPTSPEENSERKMDASKTPANSLSDMFKPTTGSWECSGCLIVNKPDINSCPACLTSKPGSIKPSPCQGNSTAFSDMFKPAAGSWECSGCYIVNKPDINSCPACQTSKPGCEKSSSNIISDNKSDIFTVKPLSFGMPASASPFNFGFSAPTTTTTTTFSFGMPPTTASISMPTMAVTSTAKNESVTLSSVETGAFSWKPAVETTIVPTPQLQTSNTQELIFGSPGKAEFSFSGVKSPKPKNQSICESEDGVVAEEEDDNIYFEPVIPLPEKVEVITGEENEAVLFSHRAKLFRLCSGEWKERGLGDIKILQHKETLKIRLLMRREQVLKICLNHYLSREMEFKVKDDKSYFWGATDFTENEPSIETFAIRFKTADIAKSFLESIKKAQASILSSPDKTTQRNIQSIDVSSSSKICDKNSKPITLQDMFKPTVGSWECTGCLIVNNPDVTSCPACKTSKPGLELQEGKSNANAPKSTLGAKPLAKPSVFSSFSFGLSTAPTTTTFSFGLPSVSSSPTPQINQLNDADSIQVLFEKKASPELREKARKLKLPENFYLFENAEPCPGCIGCEKEDLKTGLCETPSNSLKSGMDNVKINLFGEATQKAISTSTFAPTTPGGLFGSSTATTIKFGSSLPDISSTFGIKSSFGISSTFAAKPIEVPPLFGVSPSLSAGNIFGSKVSDTDSESLSNILGAKLEEKPAASPAAGLFGVKPSDAQPLFGGRVSVSSPIFGGIAEEKPVNSSFNLFGAKTSEGQSLFGSANTLNSSNIFDVKTEEKAASTTPFSLFGTKPESQPLFGTLPSMGSPSIFGGKIEDKSASSGGLFGGKISEPKPLFGSTPSGSSSNIFSGKTEEKTATPVTFSLFESKTPGTQTPLFGFSTPVASNVESKAPQPPLLFGAAHSTSNIFGGKPVEGSIFGKPTDQSQGIFGIKAVESNSIFASKTNESLDNFNSTSSGVNTSIFGGETNKSIFGPNPGETNTSIFSQIGQANDISVNTPIFENKSSNIFSPKPDDSIFGKKAIETTEKSLNSMSNQILNKPSAVDSTSALLFSSPASAVSFGDVAKTDASFSFMNSTPSDPSAWVSKPLFGGGVKSPEKEENDDYDPHYEPVIPMPDLVEIKTGEEGWQELFSQRAKLFRYDVETKSWKERGIGEFKIQFEPQLKRYRLLQRREQIHKLSCNHYLTSTMELEPMLTSEVAWCWFATDYSEKEGEAIKLAVKFKTKDVAIKFQELFNECKSKLALNAMTSQQTSGQGDLTASSIDTAQADSTAQNYAGDNEEDDDDDDDEDEDTDSDGQTGSSQQHADGDYEDVEDYEQTALMTESCSLYKFEDGVWQEMGEGDMCIYFDNESNGARIVVTTPYDDRISDNLITMESTMNIEGNDEISWRAIDELSCPPESVRMKAKFLSPEAAQNFQTTFVEGKGFAEHHCIKEQDVLLYYGVETNDD